MRHTWVVLVDGDDSIWECNIYFRRADEACIGLLHSLWSDGPKDDEILALRRAVHRARLKRYGFSLHCFQDAWIETYRQLCRQFRQLFDAGVARMLWAIGEVPLHEPYTLFPGVIEAFEQIRAAGHTIHLLTTGDDALQRSKSTRNGLDPYFGRVHVVQHSKQGVMWTYKNRHRRVIMAGDSMERDIVTARGVGIEAALITSDHADSRPSPNHDGNGHHIINHIGELLPMLQFLPLHPTTKPRRP